MPKTQPENPAGAPAATRLSAKVRRHLGHTLRGHYAESLTAPVSERLEALIAQLNKTKP